MDKYGDTSFVDNLIAQKTRLGLCHPDPDAPDNAELTKYEELRSQVVAGSVLTTRPGHACAGQYAAEQEASNCDI